jgi:hypothetical protein
MDGNGVETRAGNPIWEVLCLLTAPNPVPYQLLAVDLARAC